MMDEQYYLGLIRQKDQEVLKAKKEKQQAELDLLSVQKLVWSLKELNSHALESEKAWRELAEKRAKINHEQEREIEALQKEVISTRRIVHDWEQRFLAMQKSQRALQIAIKQMEEEKDSWKDSFHAGTVGLV